MDQWNDAVRSALRAGLVLSGVWLALTADALAQAPQVDIANPPGAPNARAKLGAALGASGTSGFDASPVTTQQSIFSGRPGPGATRVPINQLGAPKPPVMAIQRIAAPAPIESVKLPQYGQLDVPIVEEEEGPPDGLTLNKAIEELVQQNLNLIALRYEVPMAQADVLTASLRNNPIFYADSQLVPYGHFSNQRPGGQTQYDVNVTLPLDVWRKRKARIMVAEAAKRVTEAQLQDAVRLQIDNLYTAYVDAVAARLTLRFSERYAGGLKTLLDLNEKLKGAGFIKPADVLAIKARLELAELQIRESTQTMAKTRRTLALLLNVPLEQSDSIAVRASIFNAMPLPVTREALIDMAMAARPDLAATRMGLSRANADARLARRERFSDVYLLYQPYTFQNNSPMGLKSSYSYAFGVTVSLPVYNRNQGNILRSDLNAEQSKVEVANQERQVVFDVDEAIREFQISLANVLEFKREVLPASGSVRDTAFNRWKGGETSALDYLEAQQEYNDVVKQYRDALVRHRNAMLDLNTAVGTRVLP